MIRSPRAGRTSVEVINFSGLPKSAVYSIPNHYAVAEKAEVGSTMAQRKVHDREKKKEWKRLG